MTWLIFVGVFGAIIGSFLTVCIHRIPLGRLKEYLDGQEPAEADIQPAPVLDEKITIANPPRSFCPSCKAKLKWWHNIPILSWIFLRGKCGFCGQRIPFRYPLVELVSAALALLSYIQFGPSLTALVIYAFCAALVVISFIDYDYYIIPNVISLPGIVVGLVLAALNHFFHLFQPPMASGLQDSVLGLLVGGGFLLIVSEGYLRLRKKEGLGMGDVKLLAMTGAFFGVECAVLTIFLGSLFGAALGSLLILFSGQKMSQQLPFGPYLAIGTLLYIFTGNAVAVWIMERISGGIRWLM